MWARKRIDISWGDLIYAGARCLLPCNRDRILRQIESWWDSGDEAVTCLSVRSGWDLLLSVLNLPPGSEIVLSAITIPDMAEIIRHHGLVAVPADIDPDTLQPSATDLEAVLSSRTRAIVVAPLFGSLANLDDVARLCRQHGLLLIEDAAQSFVGRDNRGDERADANLFSFGPIKTATALGGAIMRVRDAELRMRIRQRQAEYPIATRWRYLRRVGKYAALKLCSNRILYGMLIGLATAFGRNPDRLVGSLARNFAAGKDRLERLRLQPSGPLVALLRRRLQRFDERGSRDDRHLQQRALRGARLTESLHPWVDVPGREVLKHSYWVYAIEAADAGPLVERLRSHGFDATQVSSLEVVRSIVDSTGAECPKASGLLSRMVFLPCYPEMPFAEVERMCQLIQAASGTAGAPLSRAVSPETTLPLDRPSSVVP